MYPESRNDYYDQHKIKILQISDKISVQIENQINQNLNYKIQKDFN